MISDFLNLMHDLTGAEGPWIHHLSVAFASEYLLMFDLDLLMA